MEDIVGEGGDEDLDTIGNTVLEFSACQRDGGGGGGGGGETPIR